MIPGARERTTVRGILRQIRTLARSFDYELGDQAIKALPELLRRDHNISVTRAFVRDYLEVVPGRRIEMNMWGSGLKEGRPVEIVGDTRSRLSQKHVDRFLQQIEFIGPHLGEKIVPVVIAHLATPELRRYMSEHGVLFYASFEL
jgi:hypothetical protein